MESITVIYRRINGTSLNAEKGNTYLVVKLKIPAIYVLLTAKTVKDHAMSTLSLSLC